MMQPVGNWTSSLSAIGVPPLANPNNGSILGAFVTPSTINPTNWTRSYARSAYISPLPPSDNLHILPQATVTRLLFRKKATSDGWIADAVEFARDAPSTRKSIQVRKEVILSAGTIGTPKILMLSGFGSQDVLSNADVDVIEKLPGVGQRLQDHLVSIYYRHLRAHHHHIFNRPPAFFGNRMSKLREIFITQIPTLLCVWAFILFLIVGNNIFV